MIRVHDVIEAVYPMSEYLVTRSADKALEPLILKYWYVVTKVNLDHVYVDSYYVSAEGYVFGDMRQQKFDRHDLEEVITTNNKYKYCATGGHK